MQVNFHLPLNKRPRALPIVFVLWLFLITAGITGLWLYSVSPGKGDNPPERWPVASSLRHESRVLTLLMFVHPQCPCSRASISELALLLAHSAGNLSAQIIFIEPSGKDENWTHSSLWRQALKLPETTLISDLDQRETELFHAGTSGETVVYDTGGDLIFHGGITGVRGHEGDNLGLSAVESCAQIGTASLARTPVFGCPLYSEAQTR